MDCVWHRTIQWNNKVKMMNIWMCICTTPYCDSKWSQSGSFSYVTWTSVLSPIISEHSLCRLQLEMDMPERNAFKLGNRERAYLSCITHAAPATESIVVIQNKYARCWCCNVHSVLAYTRAVSQNHASSLDRQHFCASLNRSARAMSMNAPARVRCAKTRSARRLSALWDTAGEKCRA